MGLREFLRGFYKEKFKNNKNHSLRAIPTIFEKINHDIEQQFENQIQRIKNNSKLL